MHSTLYAVFLTLLVSFAAQQLWRRLSKPRTSSPPSFPRDLLPKIRTDLPNDIVPNGEGQQIEPLQTYKSLYFKLHNLEQYSEALDQAWDTLLSLFSETISHARDCDDPGILSLTSYSPKALNKFLHAKAERISAQWEAYVSRRKAGSPRELFQDEDAAIHYLKQIAPLKLVDGAWLGHIHKVTTPFAMRPVTKMAWQVLSEELGDGCLEKNHVRIYGDLIKSVGIDLPGPDKLAFIDSKTGLDDVVVWKAALSQLLISLFPNEFLPEILGYNLAFEALTLQTLMVAKELDEVKINPYYFLVHVTIDNSDSGHTAMAAEAVIAYLDRIRREDGDAAVDQAWRRVQAGFTLAEGCEGGVDNSLETSVNKSAVDSATTPDSHAKSELTKLFERKAVAANKLHCTSRLKISGRTLDEWLNPSAFASTQWQTDFFTALSNAKPWVRKGDSENSRLIRELHWGGKMFGAFTEQEIALLKRWIDSLEEVDCRAYWSFTCRTSVSFLETFSGTDIQTDHSVMHYSSKDATADLRLCRSLSERDFYRAPQLNPNKPKTADFFPLWFTHPCVLSGFAATPVRAASNIGSASLRILRAQYGFDQEGPIVSGMDEVRRFNSAGIIELGLEMMKRLDLPTPSQLRDIYYGRNSAFALQLLHLSTKPMENANLLLGLSWSFMQMHEIMIESTWLPPHRRMVMEQIVRRERESLAICLDEIKLNGNALRDFERGYGIGRRGVGECFHPIE